MENILVGDGGDVDGDKMSLAQVVKTTEANILGSSLELKEIVIESGEMAESLFERVNEGYNELTVSTRGQGIFGIVVVVVVSFFRHSHIWYVFKLNKYWLLKLSTNVSIWTLASS